MYTDKPQSLKQPIPAKDDGTAVSIKVSRQHPNIWLLAEKLKTEDKLDQNCVVKIEIGDAPSAQLRK